LVIEHGLPLPFLVSYLYLLTLAALMVFSQFRHHIGRCCCRCVETRLLELACGCHGDVVVTSLDGAQSKPAVSLPKRAETFTAFDSKQKAFGTHNRHPVWL